MGAPHACLGNLAALTIPGEPKLDLLLQVRYAVERDQLLTILEQLAQTWSPIHHLESSCTSCLKSTHIDPPSFTIIQVVEDNPRTAERSYLLVVVHCTSLVHFDDRFHVHPQRRGISPQFNVIIYQMAKEGHAP